ncbi:hypothetical protein Taro_034917 [Colocasia esculenta]|uniref:Reverse transcriptase domain-containing protein n=1 Tax=Colocasia esculenta TaxID=4460 RepID=A0A843VSU1_COLES|nr:hypothetical protein [Colocasia esculenta]
MKDYDAILGLDWLEEHYALVDCRRKRIVFRIPGEDEFSHPLPRNLAGKLVISAMKAMRMVNKGCDAFLASVLDPATCCFKELAGSLRKASPTSDCSGACSRPQRKVILEAEGSGIVSGKSPLEKVQCVVTLRALRENPGGGQVPLKFEMADRRDWGGGGDDPEESTQRMIERIWESLNDIQRRMDQQAPVPSVAVPPGDGETVPIAPVPPGVEVPFVAPLPPPPPVLLAEEPVMQVEKFLSLQPPNNSGGPNLDTTEHWVPEIERVFATMRCPAADKLVLAAYQCGTGIWTSNLGGLIGDSLVDANLCDLQNIVLREFPTELVTCEAHPYPHRLRPVRGRWTRIRYVIGLTGLVEVFRHNSPKG